MKKLSPAQQRVLDKMREGWQLSISTTISFSICARIQKGKCGHGGESLSLKLKTARALVDSGHLVLDPKSDWRQDIYDPKPIEP